MSQYMFMFLFTSIPAKLETPIKRILSPFIAEINIEGGILALPRRIKQIFVVGYDILAAIVTVWMAFSLRLEIIHMPYGKMWVPYILSPLLMLPLYIFAGLYRAIHRYSGFEVFVRIINASGAYAVLYIASIMILDLPDVPRSVALIQPLLFVLSTAGSRAMVRFLYNVDRKQTIEKEKSNYKKMLIYGAGAAGAEIANSIRRSAKYNLIGYLDDDTQLHGHTINGMPVYNPDEADDLIFREGINSMLLAIPSLSRARRNEIVRHFEKMPLRIQMIPGLDELVDGRVSIADVREVEIIDLLGRDPLQVNYEHIKQHIAGKVVMVTGAGGSIGSELSRQLLAANPSALLLIEQAEYNLYTIHNELVQRNVRLGSKTRILPLLCDVTDTVRVAEIFSTFNPDVVYHAAAYKHVPMVEHNPAEGVRNNVFGTLCVAEAAMRQGVTSFVLVSTDKAVRPTNIMGASKRLCEMILQAFAAEQGHSTCFSMVRFGNVLGSSGSVVPLFRRQIREGGPITITHPEITRFFMSIPEAAQLVINAGTFAQGGEVFLLDMGEPIKIIELARRMVELSGLTVRDNIHPDGDIEIKIVGLRPGEKLYEELLIGNNPKPTPNLRIFKANEQFVLQAEIKLALEGLNDAINRNDVNEIKELLKRIISEYQSSTKNSDILCIEKELCNLNRKE